MDIVCHDCQCNFTNNYQLAGHKRWCNKASNKRHVDEEINCIHNEQDIDEEIHGIHNEQEEENTQQGEDNVVWEEVEDNNANYNEVIIKRTCIYSLTHMHI